MKAPFSVLSTQWGRNPWEPPVAPREGAAQGKDSRGGECCTGYRRPREALFGYPETLPLLLAEAATRRQCLTEHGP